MSYDPMRSGTTGRCFAGVVDRASFCRQFRSDCGKTSVAQTFSRRAGRSFAGRLIAA